MPLNGSASYAEIARKVRLPEPVVRRLLRYAMQNHLFAEKGDQPGSDRVVHTATTAYIVRVPIVRSLIAYCMENAKPAAACGVEALWKFFEGTEVPTEEQNHCAWPLAYEDGKARGEGCWEYLENHEKLPG